MTTSPLRQLADIISSSVDKIDVIFQKANATYPDLDNPFNYSDPAESLSLSPEVLQTSTLIVAACAQLSATVNIPALTLYDVIGGFHVSSAFHVGVAGNVVEILRDHPEGMSVADIANKNGMDPTRLARILRMLATHHVFAESSPDVFRNNRLSSLMDTMKSVEEIQAKPANKHLGTPGMSALIECSGDEIFKSSAYLKEVLLDPVMGKSEAIEHSPFAVAFKTNKNLFEWFEEPGNEFRLNRFSAAMAGSAKLDPPNAIFLGFRWADLPTNATVVDVGGGIGHITLRLVENNRSLRYIVQDRPAVIEQANKFWNDNLPNAILDETVTLMSHDFFTEQPIAGAAVYLLRTICHDYAKEAATLILRRLRDVANSDSKLLLIEQIVPYACEDAISNKKGSNIPGSQQVTPPHPLIANLGKATAIANIGDLHMFCANGGEERTLGTWMDLTHAAGWRIAHVYQIPGSLHKQILAVPL